MNHLGTKPLETNRLILRRFVINDIQDIYDNWASDAEVTKFLMWPTHRSTEDTRTFFSSLIEKYSQANLYSWGIELKELGKVVGNISVVGLDEKVESVHIGYCIGKPWWNKGITSEAFKAVIKYLMEEVKVNRIESRHDPKNPNSGKVMEKCGLKFEGILKESDYNNQGICDAAWYALLKKEYFETVG